MRGLSADVERKLLQARKAYSRCPNHRSWDNCEHKDHKSAWMKSNEPAPLAHTQAPEKTWIRSNRGSCRCVKNGKSSASGSPILRKRVRTTSAKRSPRNRCGSLRSIRRKNTSASSTPGRWRPRSRSIRSNEKDRRDLRKQGKATQLMLRPFLAAVVGAVTCLLFRNDRLRSRLGSLQRRRASTASSQRRTRAFLAGRERPPYRAIPRIPTPPELESVAKLTPTWLLEHFAERMPVPSAPTGRMTCRMDQVRDIVAAS